MASLAGCAGSGVDQAATVTSGGSQSTPVAMQGIVHGGNLPVSGATIQLWQVGTTGYGSAPTPLIPTSNNYYPGGATGCTASTSAITSFSITSNVVTFTASSTVVPPVYSYVTISGLVSPAAVNAGLNGQTLIVTSSSATQFTAVFTASTVGGTSDSGTATEVCQSNVISTYAGGFTLSPSGVKSYSCTAGTMVYLTATGGNPGLDLTTTTSNSALAMMVAIGNCSNLTTTTFLAVNEVTTVAGIWALQQFIGITPGTTLSSTLSSSTPAFRIGANGTAGSVSYYGITGAFEIAGDMVSNASGSAAGSPSGSGYTPVSGGSTYTAEYYQINSIANTLAACVNTSGPTSTACANLFSYTKPGSGTAPADVLQAGWEMAQNPTSNVSNLVSLASAQASFSPFAASVNDFTVGMQIVPSHSVAYYLNRPYSIAFDSYGNMWISSAGGDSTTSNTTTYNFVSEFDPAGQPLGRITQYNLGTTTSTNLLTFTGEEPVANMGNYQQPFPIAIDPNNNVWLADGPDGVIVKIPASTGAGVASPGIATPARNLAVSTNSSGGGANSFPSAISVDGNGNVWYALQGNAYLSSTSTPLTGTTFTPALGGISAASITTAGTTGPLTGLFSVSSNGSATATPSSVDAATSYSTTGNPILSLVVDTTSSSTYPSGPLVWAVDGFACGQYGQFLQFFSTASSGSSQPTITQGEATPLSLMASSAQTTCSSTSTPKLITGIANGSDTYNNTTYATYASKQPQGAAADGLGNIWVINAAKDSATTTYTTNSLSRLTPSYTDTSGVLGGTVTASTFTTGAFANATAATIDAYIAIDGANNIWFASSGPSDVPINGASPATNTTVGSFVEFNSAGVDISSQQTSTVTQQYGYIGAFPTVSSGSSAVATSFRGSGARKAVAIDLAGNVWSGSYSSNGATLYLLIGAAAPTSPLSQALMNGTLGSKP